MGHPTLASEFPHDNAEISLGAVWICPELTGPATAELTPYRPVPAEPFVLYFDDGHDSGVDAPLSFTIEGGQLCAVVGDPAPTVSEPEPLFSEPEPEPAIVEAEPAVAEIEPEPPAFAHFEAALTAALMAQGASRSAALVGRLLRLEPLPPEAVSKDVQLTLQSRGYLDSNLRYSQKWRDLCGAWCAVLRGSSQDFAACGTTTLDRFGADLLAALLAVPATRADELRRGLRKAGVAAFGVLQAA
ncbi:MAG TPA: hypothetical protein VEQ58_07215 [Polyangiaceae bacterium]|nr:hypothetical protein [Polyangiaceae bacterium]